MTQPTCRLVALKVSPWSERAKWALDHHGVAYANVEHLPVIGERRLRKLVGPAKPRATVPVLVADGEVLTESWDIAAYADRVGKGTPLFPSEHAEAIRAWTRLADDTMQSGRALIMASMLRTPAALDDSLPPAVPRWMRPLLRPLMRQATKAFARKYGANIAETKPHVKTLRGTLDRLRAQLGAQPTYLLGQFTYADIVMAGMLQGISPVDDRYLRLRPGTRLAWTKPDLAADYADLVAWRDALYAKHRLRSV